MEAILWSNEVIMAVDETNREAGSPGRHRHRDGGLTG